MANYNGITWNSKDLLSCKNALIILLKEGTSIEVIYELELKDMFGSLDVSDVIEEYLCK